MRLDLEKNVGNTDRFIRIIVGSILVYVGIMNPYSIALSWQWVLGIVGTASIIEGILGY